MSINVELRPAPSEVNDQPPFCSGTITLTRGRHPVGRGMPELDGIKDNRVSRQQVEILVEEDAAYVVRLGKNPSTLGPSASPHDQKTLLTGHKTSLVDGSVLCLLPDFYALSVKILRGETPASSGDSNKPPLVIEQSAQSPVGAASPDSKKRKADAPAEDAAAAKAHAPSATDEALVTGPLPPPPSVAPPEAKGSPARSKSKPTVAEHSSDEIMGEAPAAAPAAAAAAVPKVASHAKSKAAPSDDDLVILDDVAPKRKKTEPAQETKPEEPKSQPPSQEKKGSDVKAQPPSQEKKGSDVKAQPPSQEKKGSDVRTPRPARDAWLREINGDLFTTNASIVHCVSKDLAMSKGIAKVIYDRFLDPKKIADLERQDKGVGDVAVARIAGDKRFIFNLITKNKFFDKPVYEALEASLIELRERCFALSVDHIAMPQIGCGMDKLEWPRVRQILVNVFGDGKITVSVYNISTHSAPSSPAKQATSHHHSPPAPAAAASAPHHTASSNSPVAKKPTGPAPKLTWKEEGTLLVYDSPSLNTSATTVAAFDLDGTLIQPKSGNKFPKGRDDWKWLYPSVPTQLRTLHHNGTRVIIISNQKGITGANGKARKEDITGKLTDIVAQLGIPVQCFVATAGDHWRKPNSDIWDLIAQRSSTQPNAATSFYVGDAAGRKGDHSDSDRGFAVNSGIGFFTPEQYFLGQKAEPFAWKGFDPASVKDAAPVSISFPPHRELVICVGPPAIGKSTFVTRTFVPKGYVRVNQDQLGTKEKCLAEADAALASGKSVVIDNTNPARATRAQYLSLAKKYNVRARCLVFATDVKLAKHLNHLRERLSGTSLIPDIAYRMFAAKFEEPAQSEGFEQVVKIPFVPEFSSAKHKRLYHQRTSPA